MERKIQFWLKVAGWSGLLSGSTYLILYQTVKSMIFLVPLIIVIIFSTYILTTSKEKMWLDSKRLLLTCIFAFFFVSLIQGIFMAIAYFYSRKLQQNK